MSYQEEINISCSEFEENLTDYLDKALDKNMHKAVAAHALRCPLCHQLLNEVKEALEICHEISAPKHAMTHLEARILSVTVPETAMPCEEFENYLTDYLDGFLPAPLFHRWERHAVLCSSCTDLPGAVVRSIATLYTYKNEELAVPAGLHDKILQATLGTTEAEKVKPSWAAQFGEWLRGLSIPISVPQLAPVAMMLVFAVLLLSQTTTADGNIGGIYQKSFELAGQTYRQGADVVLRNNANSPAQNQEPVEGTFVNEEK